MTMRSLTDEMLCGACGLPGAHEIHQGVYGEFHDFDFIRREIRELVARGNITLKENESIRCNSYERELMIPALTDEAFVKQMTYCVGQCSPRRDSATYDAAVTGMYAPELLKRFKRVSREAQKAETFAVIIDDVRKALGQSTTHYLVVADDVRELVHWVEKDNCDALTALERLRAEPGSGHPAVKVFKGFVSSPDIYATTLTESLFPIDLFFSKDGEGRFELTPDGHINNCSLANFDEEKNCQICGGTCPDRDKFQPKTK